MTRGMRVLSIAGGGIRCLAAAGALLAGEVAGYATHEYDVFTGDSSGALIAALCANGWSGSRIADFLVETNIKALLTPLPWGLRKLSTIARPVSLEGVARLLDDLRLDPNVPLLVNSWDGEDNRQVLFCEAVPAGELIPRQGGTFTDVPHSGTVANRPVLPMVWKTGAFSQLGYGTVLTRSMALPGLIADSDRWLDGALGEHPPLEVLPADAHVTLIDLGFSGLVESRGESRPRTLLQRALYAYEVTASVNQSRALQRFHHLRHIEPRIYDVDSTNFALSSKAKRAIIQRAYFNTLRQWE